MTRSYARHALHFSSLTSVTQAITHYDSFHWVSEHQDYSRLKQRARQKAVLEKVTKTLVVKGSVLLVDLTDEVERVGDAPICGGSFADVWKGVWASSQNGTQLVRGICSQSESHDRDIDRWHSSTFVSTCT